MEKLIGTRIERFKDNNAYWAQYQEKVVANTMQSVYENFLYSYDQSMGIRSYGACVDLLAQKYGTQEN